MLRRGVNGPVAMPQRALGLATSVPGLAETADTRLPVWFCNLAILGVSAGCYALIFWIIAELNFW